MPDANVNGTLAGVLDLSSRDRLLLAFANLNSHGVAARGPLNGDPGSIRAQMHAELAERYPHGTRSFAFWTDSSDAAFDDQGNLASGRILPIHISNARDVPAALEALSAFGLTARVVPEGGVVLVEGDGGAAGNVETS